MIGNEPGQLQIPHLNTQPAPLQEGKITIGQRFTEYPRHQTPHQLLLYRKRHQTRRPTQQAGYATHQFTLDLFEHGKILLVEARSNHKIPLAFLWKINFIRNITRILPHIKTRRWQAH